MVVLIVAGYLLLKHFGVFSFAKNAEGIASLGAVFAVGLVAATSTCLAVVGGLLLAVAAKWTETHQSASRWHRFQPLLSFNVGRLAGYFLLGGIVGWIGTAITLSPQGNGNPHARHRLGDDHARLNILRIVPKRYCTIRPADHDKSHPVAQRIAQHVRASASRRAHLLPPLRIYPVHAASGTGIRRLPARRHRDACVRPGNASPRSSGFRR